MNIEKIREKARLIAYFNGLNIRLIHIAGDLAKIEAQNEEYALTDPGEITEEMRHQETFRRIYREKLIQEAAGIREITETPTIKKTNE